MPNTLKGWKERAQKAEAEVVRLRDLAEGLMKDALAYRLTDGRADQYDRQAELALKVAKAAEAWHTATSATAALDFADDLGRAVDEWRAGW